MTISADDVKAITGSELPNTKIDPFIADAQCVIDAAAECVTITAGCQDRALANLAAHYLVTSEVGKASAQTKREKLEDVYDVEYVVAKGSAEDLGSTEFGKKANMMMGGCLNELGRRPTGLHSIGSHGSAEDNSLC